jgi:hypothetical protein
MRIIYGQAFLTIYALSSSNAGVGLLGFSETFPRDMPQDISGSTKTCAYVSMPPNLWDISDILPYEQRAWTFQERLLSKRCLLFTATHIYFRCRNGISSNNAFGKRPSITEFLDGREYWDPLLKFWGDDKRGVFGVKIYLAVVENYTSRNLSYPEDALDAFSVISSHFESYYSTRIHKRIPEPAFVVFLGWLGVKPLKRRKQVHDQPLHPSRVFPSWSWIGWEGPISFITEQNSYGYLEPESRSFVSRFVLEDREQFL